MTENDKFNGLLNKVIGVLAFEFAIEISGKENQVIWSILALIIVVSLARTLAVAYPQKQDGFIEFLKQAHVFIIGYLSLIYVLLEVYF